MWCRAFSLVAIAMLAYPFAVAAEGAREANERRHVSAERAVIAIRKEAMAAWRKAGAWPRDRADFAQARGLRVDRVDLVYALGEPRHRNTTFDAYVRWQLLSFADERTFADLPSAHHIRLASNLPRLGGERRAATTAGALEPTVNTARSGSAVEVQAVVPAGDPRYVTLTMQASRTSLVRLRRVRQAMDRELEVARRAMPADPLMALRFRNALIERLPAEHGARLLALARDTHDRLEAGHRSAIGRAAALHAHLEPAEGPLRLNPRIAEALRATRTRLTRLDWPDPASGDEAGDHSARGAEDSGTELTVDRSALRAARDKAVAVLRTALAKSDTTPP